MRAKGYEIVLECFKRARILLYGKYTAPTRLVKTQGKPPTASEQIYNIMVIITYHNSELTIEFPYKETIIPNSN